MRVAFVSPPFGQTGGPELTTSQLADALVARGVDVTLFAPGDFKTKARLIPTLEKSIWNDSGFHSMSEQARHNIIVSSQVKVLGYQKEFDLVHISSQRYGYATAKNLSTPSVITLHNHMKPDDYALLKESGAITVALTEIQRSKMGADHCIYPGIPLGSIMPSYQSGKGLVTIGRITDQKGIHTAIAIAKKAGKPLTIVGRIGTSPERQAYYEQEVAPHINGSIRLVEHVDYADLLALIASSEALLFPIARPETFGRVSIEALACGTPVIGTLVDPLPEILTDSKTSFLSDDIDALAEAAKHPERFDRHRCREYAEERFDISTTAEKHILLYEKILKDR
jgi:hypothetical protein